MQKSLYKNLNRKLNATVIKKVTSNIEASQKMIVRNKRIVELNPRST